jgi:hypothetical protein
VDQDLTPGVSRRTLLKTVGAGTAVIWAAPAVTSLSASAFASSTNPHPECIGATCDTFEQCSSGNPDCVCTTTSEGGGFCIPGSTHCADLADCTTSADCSGGAVCIVNTCCGGGKCAPQSLGDSCPKTESVTKSKSPSFPAGSIGAR